MIEKKYPYLITYLQQTIFRCRKARWVVVMLLTMVLCGDMGRGQIRTPSDMSNTGGQGGGAAIVGWNGVFLGHFSDAKTATAMAAKTCTRNLGCTTAVIKGKAKKEDVMTNLNPAKKIRLFCYYGHAELGTKDGQDKGDFKGLLLDNWGYGIYNTASCKDNKAEMCLIWACCAGQTKTLAGTGGEAGRMKKALGATVWVGPNFVMYKFLHDPCAVLGTFLSKCNGMKTVGDVVRSTVMAHQTWPPNSITIIGDQMYVLDTTR